MPLTTPTPEHLAKPGVRCPHCLDGNALGDGWGLSIPSTCGSCGGTAWLTADRIRELLRIEQPAELVAELSRLLPTAAK